MILKKITFCLVFGSLFFFLCLTVAHVLDLLIERHIYVGDA